jgi:hypothetical protein
MMGPFWCRVQSKYASTDGSRLRATPDFLCSLDRHALSWTVRFDQIRRIEPAGFPDTVVLKSGKGLWTQAPGYGYDDDDRIEQIDAHRQLVFVFDESDVTIEISWDELEWLEFLDLDPSAPRPPAPRWIQRRPLELPHPTESAGWPESPAGARDE